MYGALDGVRAVKKGKIGVWAATHFGRFIGRRFLFEWCGMACLGIVIVLLCVFLHLTTIFDRFVYDLWLRARTLPVSPDIVLVDIDDASIAALGRWPWPRRLHAAMTTRLADDGAAAIVYNVLFTEPSDGDAQFAKALARRPSFLPILLTPVSSEENKVQLPVTQLARQAMALGHINLEMDNDGIVRSVALQEASGHSYWPQLMVPVADAIRNGTVLLPDARNLKQVASPLAMADTGRMLISFSRDTEDYRHVSFIDVLAGRVSPDVLKNRIVLVGVTASGLYEHFATPLSGELGSIPGLYVHANVLDMLMHGTVVKPAAVQWVALASLVPLAILLAGFFVLTPLRVLILEITLGAASFAGSAALLFRAYIWLSPAPAVVALLAVYLVWNWRRLEMTMVYLREKLHQFADEPYLLAEVPAVHHRFDGDPLEQQMALMAQAVQRLQEMRRFIWDSLDCVPELVFVTDRQGMVRFINRMARERFVQPGTDVNTGRHIRDMLDGLSFVKTIDDDDAALTRGKGSWPALLDPLRGEYAALMAHGIEVRDEASARNYLLRYVRHDNVRNEIAGWIAGLFDISALRTAQQQHEEALRLLSHDMRSPQASILTLIETERQRGRIDTESMRVAMESIERYARRTIWLAETFVQLARAESKDYEFEPLNFTDLLIDAIDEVWPQAQAKHIQIDTQHDPSGEPANMDNADNTDNAGWVCADRSMMTRALVNILNNSVKYSPSGTKITCSVHLRQDSHSTHVRTPASLICVIRDRGYGMTAQEQARFFEPFRRFHTKSQPQIDGVGLGMTFVQTVVLRHDGEITVESEPGQGTAITISLPVMDVLPV